MDVMDGTKELLVSFAREDHGAQVVEYALVIALVSIGLALALAAGFSGTPFSTFVSRVQNCLTGGTCTAS